MSILKRNLKLVAIAIIATGLAVFGSTMQKLAAPNLSIVEPVMAQVIRPQEVWRRVYQQLPDLPLENQYVNKESGKVDPDNTLVSRFIRYHVYVKGRPPNYRLDWKLTVADYLGENELMEEGVYPGYDSLRENPIEKDKAAIARLTRSQRNALIQVIVNIFNPAAATQLQPTTAPTNAPEPSVTPNSRPIPQLPQPGDAQRLRL